MDLLFSGPVMWFVFGFLVGWGLLPQPEWAKPLLAKVMETFASFFNKPPTPPTQPPTPSANT